MRDQAIPVVRLEVEYMKHAILHAFTEHTLKVDADVKAAVERFCRPENIAAIVEDAVNHALKEAIYSEIENFYRYGAGKAHIVEAVRKRLSGDSLQDAPHKD